MKLDRFPFEYLLIILVPLSLYCGARFIGELTKYPWNTVSCVITSAYIEPNPEESASKLPHRAEIVYSCDDPNRGIHMWEDFATESEAKAFLTLYQSGRTVTGFKSNNEIVLARQPIWYLSAYLIPIALTVFVLTRLKKQETQVRKDAISSAVAAGEKRERMSPLRNVKEFDQSAAVPLEDRTRTEEWKEMLGHSDEKAVGLKPRRSQLMQFIGMLVMFAILIALTIWTSLSAYKTWKAGQQPGCAVAAAPFLALASARLLFGLTRQLLGLVNPRPQVQLSSASTWPGGSMDLSWRYEGKVGGAKKIVFMLVGREYTTVRQTQKGKTRDSSKAVASENVPIYEAKQDFEIREGRARIRIPENLMHSFHFGYTKIEWLLRVEVKIGGWADVHEEYPLVILPAPMSS